MDRRAWRGVWVLVVAVLAAGTLAVTPATAGKFLTKKKALKLFYTKMQADSQFLDKGEGDASYLDQAEGDARYVGKTETRTGIWSCVHWVFQGITSDRTSTTGGFPQYKVGEGPFACHVNLPNGATISSFQATVHDSSATEQEGCYLESSDLASTFGASDVIAGIFSGLAATPGNVRMSATFTPETVNNQNFGYDVACVGSSTSATGFYGVTIGYTLTGDEGAAS